MFSRLLLLKLLSQSSSARAEHLVQFQCDWSVSLLGVDHLVVLVPHEEHITFVQSVENEIISPREMLNIC